jgi:predicted NBD/HSP70 family sugar kinase
VDRDAGVVAEHSLLGWRDVPAAGIVARRLAERGGAAVVFPGPVRDRPAPLSVHVDSHTRALIRAEQLFGRLDPRHSVLALFAGNVVDAAFALGDRVNRGPRSGAGDVAHWPVPGSHQACECGRSGCLQTALSELRLVEQGLASGLIEAPADGSDAVDALLGTADAGDAAARELFVTRSALAGRALAPLADFLNPDVVLVVDRGTARFGEALAALHDALVEHSSVARTRRPSVIVSSFMSSPLAIAAGTVALDVLYRNPLAVPPRRSAS